ncbi:MAG: DUF2062 domain-containing protein [Gammaproteobacteria bacterium]|nr:DUF2062 domain-containing protein [Gammaproteobacteria bacterium]
MAKRLLKRFVPDHKVIKEHKLLRSFGTFLHNPNLWHLNRRSVPKAFAIGLFMAFVPVPFQMWLSAGAAIVFEANLPISVALVWLTNPLTMPPIFYFCYLVGTWILDAPEQAFAFELTWDWLIHKMAYIWEPFLLGCFVLGTISAILGYFVIKLFWVFRVRKDWQLRRQKRLLTRVPPHD